MGEYNRLSKLCENMNGDVMHIIIHIKIQAKVYWHIRINRSLAKRKSSNSIIDKNSICNHCIRRLNLCLAQKCMKLSHVILMGNLSTWLCFSFTCIIISSAFMVFLISSSPTLWTSSIVITSTYLYYDSGLLLWGINHAGMDTLFLRVLDLHNYRNYYLEKDECLMWRKLFDHPK